VFIWLIIPLVLNDRLFKWTKNTNKTDGSHPLQISGKNGACVVYIATTPTMFSLRESRPDLSLSLPPSRAPPHPPLHFFSVMCIAFLSVPLLSLFFCVFQWVRVPLYFILTLFLIVCLSLSSACLSVSVFEFFSVYESVCNDVPGRNHLFACCAKLAKFQGCFLDFSSLFSLF